MGEANPAWVPGENEPGSIEERFPVGTEFTIPSDHADMFQHGPGLLEQAWVLYSSGAHKHAAARLAEAMLISPPVFHYVAGRMLDKVPQSTRRDPAWPGFTVVLRTVIAFAGTLRVVTVEAPSPLAPAPPPARPRPPLESEEEFRARLDAMVAEDKAMKTARRKLRGDPA
jgi:hypothetical protein